MPATASPASDGPLPSTAVAIASWRRRWLAHRLEGRGLLLSMAWADRRVGRLDQKGAELGAELISGETEFRVVLKFAPGQLRDEDAVTGSLQNEPTGMLGDGCAGLYGPVIVRGPPYSRARAARRCGDIGADRAARRNPGGGDAGRLPLPSR
jgi:hypothetical protein